MNIKSTINLLMLTASLFPMYPGSRSDLFAAEPTIQTISFTSAPGSCNEIDLSFVWGNGTRRLIVASADVPVSSLPVDGHGYTASSLFGSGSNLGSNNYVVYGGSLATSLTVTGLLGGTEYYFAIFEYNGTGNNADYLLTGYLETHDIAPGFTIAVSSNSGDMCNGDSVKLEANGAETYQWSPSGSLSSATDSVVWASPSNTTQYTVQGFDSFGCSDTKSVTITVYPLPNVTLGNFSNKCINGSIYTITSGSPMGGTYSGDGISGNHFDPAAAGVGTHIITYTYSDIHGCTSFDTSTIRVLNAPVVTFSSLSDVCVDAPVFALIGGNPTGGIYNGAGVSSGQFNPALAGAGQYQLRYVYTDGSGCSDTAYSYELVRALPPVSFATLQPVCLNTTPFNLMGGLPSGGTYSGTGVSSNQFSPLVSGAGNFLLTYAYTDTFGCSADDTSNIAVHTLPSVNFATIPPRCINTGPLTLTGGTPGGGSYSGLGVAAGVFYSGIAGAGQHVLTYTYSNVYNCSNTATQTITVNAAPDPNLGPDILVCSNSSATLSSGTFTTYSWSTGAITQTINVDTTGHGLGVFQFFIIVTNSNGCSNRDTILVTFDQCNGINNLMSNGDALTVYPNPFATQFTVVAEEGSDISVYDLKGSLIMEKKNAPSIFTYGENLSSGSYFIKVTKNQLNVFKLIFKD